MKEDDFRLIIKKEGEDINFDMEGSVKDMISGFAQLMAASSDFRLLVLTAAGYYMHYKEEEAEE